MSNWLYAGYILVGLVFGAVVYHLMTDEENKKEVPDSQLASNNVYNAVTFIVVLVLSIIWPLSLLWIPAYTLWRRIKK